MPLDKFFKVVFEQSHEERELALQTFKEIKDQMNGIEDTFMIGQMPELYLTTAQKSTENLIKMVTAFQRILELETDRQNAANAEKSDIPDTNQMIKLLDDMEIGPKRFVGNNSTIQTVDVSEEELLTSEIEKIDTKKSAFEELDMA